MGRTAVLKISAVGLAVSLLGAGCGGGERRQKGVVIGKSTTTTEALPAATIVEESTTTTGAPTPDTTGATGATGATSAPIAPKPLGFPDGSPYDPAIPFTTAVAVPSEIVSVLVIGGDARPGADPRKSNGDSIHLVLVDPRTGSGTVLGFPRDSWVEVPGKGTRKINSALAMGGPKLMAQTVQKLTGLPVHYYILTAFEGFEKMVEELGGVNVEVGKKMADKASGAFFDPGWQHLNGAEALAYARNRKDTENGDFSRSLHQGNIIMSGLAKLRAEVGDDAGIQRWIGVMLKYVDLDSPPQQLTELATLARTLDPARLTNVVLPGRVGTSGGQSVVFLSDEARKIFLDLRPDAAIGGPKGDEPRPEATTTTTTAPPVTTTTPPTAPGPAPAQPTTTTTAAPPLIRF